MPSIHIDIRKSWNTVAKQWGSYMKPLFAGADFIWGPFGPTERRLKLLPKVRGKKVLVAGCGSGADVCYFAAAQANVTGIDISEEQLTFSKAALTAKGLSAKLIRGDLNLFSKLRVPRESMDLIVSSYALQYVKDLKKLFTQFYKTLKPGGTLAFSLDHPVLYAHYPKVQGKKRNRDASKFFNYLQERRLEWVFNLSGRSARAYSYHRTVGTIIKSLVSAGLEIDACVEPSPELKGVTHHQKIASIAKRIPHTLILRAKKPV